LLPASRPPPQATDIAACTASSLASVLVIDYAVGDAQRAPFRITSLVQGVLVHGHRIRDQIGCLRICASTMAQAQSLKLQHLQLLHLLLIDSPWKPDLTPFCCVFLTNALFYWPLLSHFFIV